MKRLAQIVMLSEFHYLPVMECVFKEFCGALEDYECDIRIVRTFEEIEDGGLIFLHDEAGNYVNNNRDLYIRMGKKCPNSIFVCWHWLDLSFIPFKRMIRVGSYHLDSNKALEYFQNQEQRCMYYFNEDFAPLMHRANENPDMIGTYPKNIIYDWCYMGGLYRGDWYQYLPSNLKNGFFHQVIFDNYMPYEERRKIYLSSLFAFGFQSDMNIQTTHISQRVFEGLAYGCIVLCENKMAEEFTDGAVVYVSSPQDMVEKMLYFKSNPELIEKQRKKSYEWCKKYGTNRLALKVVLDKIKSLYNEKFESNSLDIIRQNYENACKNPSDINEHVETLKSYSLECSSVCEFGVRTGVSTWGFVSGLVESGNKDLRYIGVDLDIVSQNNYMRKICTLSGIDYTFMLSDSAIVDIPEVDILFIDSWHVYGHLKRELQNNHKKVKKYIIMHDTDVDGIYGESIRMNMNINEQMKNSGYSYEDITTGLQFAIEEFLQSNKDWIVDKVYKNCNGLTILKRI